MIELSRAAHARGELFPFQDHLRQWVAGEQTPGAIAAGLDVAELIFWFRSEKDPESKHNREARRQNRRK